MCNQRGRETCASSMNTFVKSFLIGQNILTAKIVSRNRNARVKTTFSFHFDLLGIRTYNSLYIFAFATTKREVKYPV